jgi:hypothetical protein
VNTSTQSTGSRLQKAVAVLIVSIVLAAPIGVVTSVGYRASFSFEAWAYRSPYPPEELEFLQPANILDAILRAYILCAVPVLITAAAVAWRSWRRGTFGYVYAAVIAGILMAGYLAIAAYLTRRELVRVVTQDTAINGCIYAVLVGVFITALFRWFGLIGAKTDRIRIDT